jgi:hypothetical protein
VSNIRELAHACCFAQPGHWLGPVAGPGWLGLAQPIWAELGPASNKKIKKIKICVCINKKYINMNLFIFYLLMSKSGIKILIQIYFIVFYLAT